MTPRGSAPRIAVVAPRNMHFGPARATSIDLCIRDFVLHSRFRETTVVIAEEVDRPFDGLTLNLHKPGRRAAIRAIREAAPDLIVVHQHMPSAARIARAFPRTPVILHRHNILKPSSSALGALWRTRLLKRFAATIFVSNWCAREFRAAWPRARGEVRIVHNGIDFSAWNAAEEKLREIIYVGRLAPNKGVLELAEALARTLPARPDWRARLILSAPDAHPAYAAATRAALAPLGDRAVIETDIEFDAVMRRLAQAEIAVVPSTEGEPFGRTAIEAFAARCALVASTAGGLSEVVGDAGLRLDAVTAETIAAALAHLTEDDALRARLAAAGRARGESSFDIARISADLDAVYAETLKL